MDFRGGPMIKAALPLQGVWVRSLVRVVLYAAWCARKKL